MLHTVLQLMKLATSMNDILNDISHKTERDDINRNNVRNNYFSSNVFQDIFYRDFLYYHFRSIFIVRNPTAVITTTTCTTVS